MRTLRKNAQNLKYALQIGQIPSLDNYKGEYYEDEEGHKYPLSEQSGGKTEIIYSDPIDFLASISMSGGEAEAVEYGLSTSDYEAVLIIERNAVPLKEGALIWYQTEPQYKYGGSEEEIWLDDEVIKGKFPEKTSADFVVKKVSPSISFEKIILEAVNK